MKKSGDNLLLVYSDGMLAINRWSNQPEKGITYYRESTVYYSHLIYLISLGIHIGCPFTLEVDKTLSSQKPREMDLVITSEDNKV